MFLKLTNRITVLELFEGDMVMDSRLREAVLGKNTKKSAFRGRDILWPDNVVYYEIDDSFGR